MKKIVVLGLLTSVLAACGGGSNGGSNNPPRLPERPVYYGAKPKVVNDNVVLIENKRIELARESEGMKRYPLDSGKYMQIYNQQYTALGYLMPKPGNDRLNQLLLSNVGTDDSVVVAKPLSFDALPKRGKIDYVGISYAPNSQGKFLFRADFDEKMVGGLIFDQKATYGNNPENIVLADAKLEKMAKNNIETHFVGVAVGVNSKEKFGYAGMFAGPGAKEVVGLVVKGNAEIKTGFIGKEKK